MDLVKRILLLLIGTILGLAVAEGALRFLQPSSANRINVAPPGLSQEFAPAERFMPGVGSKSTFSINAEGIRGEAFDAGQEVRVLAIGGSTTECLYLDDALAWPAVLQARLNAKSSKRHWVGNVGKSGRTSDQHVLDLELLPPQFPDIDTVLVLLGVNDLQKRLMFGHQPYAPADIRVPFHRAAVFERSFLVREAKSSSRIVRAFERWSESSGAAERTGEVVQDRTGAVFGRLREARRAREVELPLPDLTTALRQYEVNLHAIADAAARQGLRLIFMSQPSMWRSDLNERERSLLWMGGIGDFFSTATREYYSVEALAAGMQSFNDSLRQIGDERRVELIDLARILPQDATVFYDDVHFNENGARQVADAVADYLRRQPSAPEGSNPPERARSGQPMETVTDLIQLEAWGPKETKVGEKFNVQPSGECAFWFKVDGQLSTTQYIQFGETILPTTRSGGVATASLTPNLFEAQLASAITVPITVVDVDQRKKQLLGQFQVN